MVKRALVVATGVLGTLLEEPQQEVIRVYAVSAQKSWTPPCRLSFFYQEKKLREAEHEREVF